MYVKWGLTIILGNKILINVLGLSIIFRESWNVEG